MVEPPVDVQYRVRGAVERERVDDPTHSRTWPWVTQRGVMPIPHQMHRRWQPPRACPDRAVEREAVADPTRPQPRRVCVSERGVVPISPRLHSRRHLRRRPRANDVRGAVERETVDDPAHPHTCRRWVTQRGVMPIAHQLHRRRQRRRQRTDRAVAREAVDDPTHSPTCRWRRSRSSSGMWKSRSRKMRS